MFSTVHPIIPDYFGYHQNCPDGKTTEVICKMFAETSGNVVKTFPCVGNNISEPIENFKDKIVAFGDYCPKRDYIEKLAKVAKYIIILDHHATNKKIFDTPFEESNIFAIFDMNRSGCGIAWDYFFPNVSRPLIVDYVEMRDLWKWTTTKLPDPKEILCYLDKEDYFSESDSSKLIDLFNKQDLSEFVERGKIYCDIDTKEICSCCSMSSECTIEYCGEIMHGRISTCNRQLRSDAGAALVNTPLKDGTLPKFGVIYYYNYSTDEWWISMRASSSSDVNLCLFAEGFGGGGHPKSSGFSLKNGCSKSIHDIFKLVKYE